MDDTSKLNRKELFELFRNGKIPSENHFKNLIDSTLNIKEDGFKKTKEEGLVIKPLGDSKRFLTLYKSVDDINSFFSFEKEEEGVPGLKLTSDPANTDTAVYVHTNGAMGIGQKAEEGQRLSVNGFIAAQGRTGNYLTGAVPANGRWQRVNPAEEYFDGCQALEVVARAGRPNSRKYAIMHALALSAYGGKSSKHRIRRTGAHFGFLWNRIRLRWRSVDANHYYLEIKTSSNYGEGATIHYRICKLWDEDFIINA